MTPEQIPASILLTMVITAAGTWQVQDCVWASNSPSRPTCTRMS
jgi:hypothetical protein